MSTKLVIENREFYFHPTHQAYAGSIDGCVVHVVTREPTFGIITEKGYFEMTVQDYWGRMYVHNFIWECFHGLLKDGQKIKHINKKCEDNRLTLFCRCSKSMLTAGHCVVSTQSNLNAYNF